MTLACAPAAKPESPGVGNAKAKLGGTAWGWRRASLFGDIRHGASASALGSRVVLFGGEKWSWQEELDETWEFDGLRWVRRFPAVSPPARLGHSMGSMDGKVLMWGGKNGWGDGIADAWTWDGQVWEPLPGGSPPESAPVVSVPGGALQYGRQTWVWTGSAWSPVFTRHAPGNRKSIANLGAEVVLLTDQGTWRWDQTGDWVRLSQDAPDGALVAGPSLAVLGGGATWTWDGAAWTRKVLALQPPDSILLAAGPILIDGEFNSWVWSGAGWSVVEREVPHTYDRDLMLGVAGDVLLFDAYSAEAWRWEGRRWRPLHNAPITPGRYFLTGAPMGTNAVVFGGEWVSGYGVYDDTWMWESDGWGKLEPTASPPSRTGHVMVGLGSQVLLYGGFHIAWTSLDSVWDDTWIFDGESWQQKHPAHTPGAVGAPRLKAATVGGKALVLSPSGAWTWDGEDWVRLGDLPPNCLLDQASLTGLGDRALLWCGGATYELNGTSWEENTRTPRPTDYFVSAMASAGSSAVFYGSVTTCGDYFNETWEYLEALVEGSACTAGLDCLSGFCTDGVCCDKPCAGQCESCALPGREGTCSPVMGTPVGRKACLSDGSTCAGTCDGVTTATCTYPTSECLAGSCADGEELAPNFCAMGACPAVRNGRHCEPYRCSGDVCASTCAVDADCALGAFCSEGACKAKALGAVACTRSEECATSHCVDGWCCNAACEGQCEACDVPGDEGFCQVVRGSPHGDRASCGPAGLCGARCDGFARDACRYTAAATPCSTSLCMSGVETPPGYCDGAGQCIAGEARPCGDYSCRGNLCGTTCDADEHCIRGRACVEHQCRTPADAGTPPDAAANAAPDASQQPPPPAAGCGCQSGSSGAPLALALLLAAALRRRSGSRPN